MGEKSPNGYWNWVSIALGAPNIADPAARAELGGCCIMIRKAIAVSVWPLATAIAAWYAGVMNAGDTPTLRLHRRRSKPSIQAKSTASPPHVEAPSMSLAVSPASSRARTAACAAWWRSLRPVLRPTSEYPTPTIATRRVMTPTDAGLNTGIT